MNRKFFGSLDHQANLLETSFKLLREKKVSFFDADTIEDLAEGNHEKVA